MIILYISSFNNTLLFSNGFYHAESYLLYSKKKNFNLSINDCKYHVVYCGVFNFEKDKS